MLLKEKKEVNFQNAVHTSALVVLGFDISY
jgi:hypothetical protein